MCSHASALVLRVSSLMRLPALTHALNAASLPDFSGYALQNSRKERGYSFVVFFFLKEEDLFLVSSKEEDPRFSPYALDAYDVRTARSARWRSASCARRLA